MNSKIDLWLEKREVALASGGEAAIQKQHDKGKYTARERMEMLFDDGVFQEIGLFARHRCHVFGQEKVEIAADGILAGYGLINGRPAYCYAHDFCAKGGTLGEMGSIKQQKVMELAINSGAPCISLNDSGGGRLQEAIISQNFLKLFWYNTRASGWVPQISAIMGSCAGGAAYSPALTDFIIGVQGTSSMFLTGPNVIKQVTGEDIDQETLGGAHTHNSISGVEHMMATDDVDCIEQIRNLLTYLPQNANEKPPVYDCTDDPYRECPVLDELIPEDSNKGYNMYTVIKELVDDGIIVDHMPLYATNIITCLGRINGHTVGFVANQPISKAGCLDVDASDKGARFIRICDSFNIPLVWLVDVPGFLPGVSQEFGGVIRHGAKLVYACCEATVPKICITIRKNYGGATAAMCSQQMGADFNFIWPTGESAIMGPDGAGAIIFAKQIKAAPEEQRAAVKKELLDGYKDIVCYPYLAVENLKCDEIIRPSDTRAVLTQALTMLENKVEKGISKKHGNIPL